MDKTEYKLTFDEIMLLLNEQRFQEAVVLADKVDWTRVRSIITLCKISDLYKVNRRYPEAKILLEQAYEKNPGNMNVVYSLCDLCIKVGDLRNACEYFRIYANKNPDDTKSLILKYKMYEYNDVNLEERIELLERLKNKEYMEKWGYELAYLYHRIGLITKCVEECDRIITWFSNGSYVKKAMELKMMHQQLTEGQNMMYQNMIHPRVNKVDTSLKEAVLVSENPEDDIKVKTMDMSKYNTINLQKELAESMKDVLVADNGFEPLYDPNKQSLFDALMNGTDEAIITAESQAVSLTQSAQPEWQDQPVQQELTYSQDEHAASLISEDGDDLPNTGTLIAKLHDTGEMEEIIFKDDEIKVVPPIIDKVPQPEVTEASSVTYDPVKELGLTMMYDSEELADRLGELKEQTELDEEAIEESKIPKVGTNTAELIGLDDTVEIVSPIEATRVFNRDELKEVAKAYNTSLKADSYGFEFDDLNIKKSKDDLSDHIANDIGERNKEELLELIDKRVAEAIAKAFDVNRPVVMPAPQPVNNSSDSVPKDLAEILSQDADGQLSFVMPDPVVVEKQITGQISIDDVLNDWENIKKEQQQKNENDVAKQILAETGDLFTDTEAFKLDGLLERLQREEPQEEIDTEAEYEKYLSELMAADAASHQEDSIASDVSSVGIEANPSVVTVSDIASQGVITAGDVVNQDVSVISDAINQGADLVSEDELQTDVEPLHDSSTEGEVEELVEIEEHDRIDTDESRTRIEEAPLVENRSMNEDELALFAQFAQTKNARNNLLHSLDKISLAAYVGNVFVTGETPDESLELAKNVIRYVKNTDNNFTGKIAKVSGDALNDKMISVMIEKLASGGLIIEKASGMSAETTKDLLRALNQEKTGIVVALQDTKKNMHRMMEYFDGMKQIFNIHIEVEELSDDALVAYGKKYAEHMEYSIDDMGILALHQRIDELQTSDHIVTVSDVRDIIDEAIEKSNKKSFRHFTDVLLAKRYDEEDMIILRENDFIN